MKKICLLVGGNSIEHDCSLHMYFFLRELLVLDDSRLEVVELYYITPSKTAYRHRGLTTAQLPADEKGLSSGELINLSLMPHSIKASGLFVFSLLQGTEGEDGQYQGWTQAFDIPSNLGSVFTSAVSMHKWTQALIATTVLAGEIKPIDTRILSSSPSEATVADTVSNFSGRPCVLKPNSLGVSAFCRAVDCLTQGEIQDFAARLAPYDDHFLVQERIFGRELISGCLQRGDQIIPLPVMEFHVPSGFLNHAAKFSKGGYSYSFVQDSDLVAVKLSKVSVELFRFMGYDTACRFDFMLSDAGDLYFLEANSKPGLTRESHYILMLKEIGYSLLDLIEFAIQNESRRFSTPPTGDTTWNWRSKNETSFAEFGEGQLVTIGVDGEYWQGQLSDLITRVRTHDMIASNQISLLAGSTTVSKTVFELMNTDLLTRGAEGRGKNIHLPGLSEFYKIEGLAGQEVAKVFSADFAELRPISGSQANMIVLAALTDIGDTVLTPAISDGGHVSTSGRLVRTLKNYKFIHPPLVRRSFRLDMDAFVQLVRTERPKIIFLGGSVITEAQCLKEAVEAAHEHGAKVVFDSSHVAGLIATGVYPNPMDDGVDLMTMTTCKTLPGPSHAWIVGRAVLEDSIRKTVFPGFVSGGHLQEYVGAIAALYEIMALGGEYGRVVVQTANLLGEMLEKAGFSVVRTASGRATDTHQVLCEGHSALSAEQVERRLEDIGILVNSNYLPKNGGFSQEKGIRFGTQEAVWLGMKEPETVELATIITECLRHAQSDIEPFRRSVATLRAKLKGFVAGA